MEVSEKTAENEENSGEAVQCLQAQLSEVRAQLEHWQGVATICELSKEEEIKDLQTNCDQEIQSLQEALRETASQYEARISSMQTERAQWRGASISNDSKVNLRRSPGEEGGEAEAEGGGGGGGRGGDPPEGYEVDHTGLLMEGGYLEGGGYLDGSSLASFSLDTPSLPRRPPPQEDTASLVSTGTLVPEAIYLPPPGHRLITHTDWNALHTQLTELQGEVTQLREQRTELERELDTQTTDTQKQVSVLQSQVQNSEALLQGLQQSFSQSQSAVQSRLAELSVSQRRVCSELSRLKGEEPEEEGASELHTPFNSSQQGVHSEERLRIEIVNLKEQLETRTEESEVVEVQLSSLKTETDRIQAKKEKLECELQACRTELQGLRVALAHLQGEKKSLSNDKVSLQQQCLEFRGQIISLHTQLDTSQTVQKDFVQLSQSLQVKLELIRQAQTLDQVKQILGEELSSEGAPPSAGT
ncbi:LOW QUALITY PROTEIN: rab GTPase-binding effector protein 2 [Clupea harengus]|uniref:Rab GTPase-binding effector protein 2 n=1 Tax=Clupea harengus TaxID=7950 RepID=A0A6P8EXI0_CLUHA|nr:LOW QUALITY PROTEIN: rab GTPase-binding effector protein 2 [Clupea harengus]